MSATKRQRNTAILREQLRARIELHRKRADMAFEFFHTDAHSYVETAIVFGLRSAEHARQLVARGRRRVMAQRKRDVDPEWDRAIQEARWREFPGAMARYKRRHVPKTIPFEGIDAARFVQWQRAAAKEAAAFRCKLRGANARKAKR